MRYAFVLWEIRKPDDGPHYEWIAQVDVDPEREGFDELRARLRPWGLSVLSSAGHDIGLYSVEFVNLDEDGEPERPFGDVHIAWSGHDELLPARQGQHTVTWTGSE